MVAGATRFRAGAGTVQGQGEFVARPDEHAHQFLAGFGPIRECRGRHPRADVGGGRDHRVTGPPPPMRQAVPAVEGREGASGGSCSAVAAASIQVRKLRAMHHN